MDPEGKPAEHIGAHLRYEIHSERAKDRVSVGWTDDEKAFGNRSYVFDGLHRRVVLAFAITCVTGGIEVGSGRID